MKLKLPASFVKYYYKNWGVWLAVAILLIATHILSIWPCLFFFLLSISRDGYHFKSHLYKLDKLKKKGLTEQDLNNIEFVKKWEETRLLGLWRYCIRDGGIIAGALLSFPGCIPVLWVFHKNGIKFPFPELSDMFAFIGYSYLVGASFGIIVYRVRWIINERRFLRLTDPLNTIFTNTKESFSDLI